MKNKFTQLLGAALLAFVALPTQGAVIAQNAALNVTRAGTAPVPEPSSQTALYVLGGAVGLGFVVMRRRRTLA